MTLINAAVVFTTSLLALPTSYVLNSVSQSKDQRLILLTGIMATCVIAVIPWLALRQRQQKVNSFYYVLSLMTFSSVMSLIIALGNDGLIAEFMGAYLREAEPYLKTAHCTMMSYWDGIAHFAMYLMMLAAVSWNQSYHDIGLYWAGSFGFSKLVMVLGVLIGKENMRWPFLLQTPAVIICALAGASFIQTKQAEVQNTQMKLSENSEKNCTSVPRIWRRPIHLCLFIYFLFAIIFTGMRFSGSMQGNFSVVNDYRNTVEPYLADPSLYPRAQMLLQAFYFIPYYMMNMYALLYPGQAWLLPWSLIFAGAAAQSQFSLIGASFHYRTPYLYRLPQTVLARCLFWITNSLLLVVPQLQVLGFFSEQSLYLRPAQPASSICSTSNGQHEGVGVGSRRGSTISNHSVRLKKSD